MEITENELVTHHTIFYIYFIMNKPKSSRSSALFQMVQQASEIL